MQQPNIESEDFNFSKKISQKIDKQVSKIDYSSYKKLAFFSIAIGVFVSAGVYFGNHLVPTLVASTNIISTIVPSNEVVQNLNNQTKKLTQQDFDSVNQYYQNIMNMYDNKLDYVNKILIQYNLQTTFSDTNIPQQNFSSMSSAINNHKEDITEKISKFNSLKNKIISKDSLSYHEAQFMLNAVENSKQHLYYHNTKVEAEFSKNLVSTHKDITKYLIAHNVYEKIKTLDDDIKQSFLMQPLSTISNINKPKV